MARVKTGNPSAYTAGDVDELADKLEAGFDEYDDDDGDGGDVGSVTVTADIEWSGTYNPTPHRSTTLGPLRLGAIRAAVQAARSTASTARRIGAQRPPRGWHAQIKELTRTKAGYAAADRAGLNVTARTVLGWLSLETTPSKANQARIEKAAIQLQYDRASAARGRAASAAREAADALTAAIRERYGAEVRLFNITDLSISDN